MVMYFYDAKNRCDFDGLFIFLINDFSEVNYKICLAHLQILFSHHQTLQIHLVLLIHRQHSHHSLPLKVLHNLSHLQETLDHLVSRQLILPPNLLLAVLDLRKPLCLCPRIQTLDN